MGSSGDGGNPGMAPQGGRFGPRVPIAGQSRFGGAGNDYGGPSGSGGGFGAGGSSGDAGAMRQQLAAITGRGAFGGGSGGMPWPGNPAPLQAPLPGATLARPAMAAATPAQMAMPTGAAGSGGGWMGYNGTGTGDWNYATQGQGSTSPYNYAGFNVSHGVGDDPAKGQVSSLSMPGTAGMLARPTGPQMGFLPRPGG